MQNLFGLVTQSSLHDRVMNPNSICVGHLTCCVVTILDFITWPSRARSETEKYSETARTLGALSDASRIIEFC